MTEAPTAAQIAGKLTKAQRRIVIESEPGAWGREEDGSGAGLFGGGQRRAAIALAAKGLGDVEEHPGHWPSALFFNNAAGLAVRAILMEQDHG